MSKQKSLTYSNIFTCSTSKMVHFSIDYIWFRRKLCPNPLAPGYQAVGYVEPKSLNTTLNTVRPDKMAVLSQTTLFFNENARIFIEISLTLVPKGSINNIPALVHIMAWRQPGDKPLSEPMMVRLPTYLCVTRPQWVNCNKVQYFWYSWTQFWLYTFSYCQKYMYRKTSNIRLTLVGNKIVDHSDVVGESPVSAAPTTSSFLT